jgi:NAD(P)-dependent dehydrogenase (short-subunit alcohol dehydrogenase family)
VLAPDDLDGAVSPSVTTVSVVTGAGGDMGSACAAALGGGGVLLLTDVDKIRLEAAAARLSGISVRTVVGDLQDPAFIADLAARAGELGYLGALVHTAGLSPSMAGWREILHVDLLATAQLLEAFLPHVTAGSVAVCVSSVSAHMGDFDAAMEALLAEPLTPGFEDRFRSLVGQDPDPGATYRLAKRGVLLLCAHAASAWGPRGGRVVSLSPGLIDTEMGRLELRHQPIKKWLAEITPVQRSDGGPSGSRLPGRIDDIANAVAFLCSERASFISGCDVRVDGGLIPAIHEHG